MELYNASSEEQHAVTLLLLNFELMQAIRALSLFDSCDVRRMQEASSGRITSASNGSISVVAQRVAMQRCEGPDASAYAHRSVKWC